VALVQHLFIGVFLTDLDLYTRVIWPINMVVLGIACIGVFAQYGRAWNMLRAVFFLLVLGLPLALSFADVGIRFMVVLSLIYAVFFALIFAEILRFLIKPSYIDVDIISASACGFLLLIETATFLFQALYYRQPDAFNNVASSSPAATYVDLVYFSTILQTTIGFGDITPKSVPTKLIASFFGIIGQFYSVVLVGILISKFTSARAKT